MDTSLSDAKARGLDYSQRRQLPLSDRLGWGMDGVVFYTDVSTAIKSFKYKDLYRQELAVYLRLRERNVEKVCGFNVPKLVNHHDELMVIEMEFVTPPFVVDFACAGVDVPLTEYSQEKMQEWLDGRAEIFGDDWAQARRVYYGFKTYGIHLADLNPGNIVFASPPISGIL
jgi:hypothetical protein